MSDVHTCNPKNRICGTSVCKNDSNHLEAAGKSTYLMGICTLHTNIGAQ